MVVNKIRDMQDKKSLGVDGNAPTLLLEIVELISIPPASVVPLEWKETNVIPLF